MVYVYISKQPFNYRKQTVNRTFYGSCGIISILNALEMYLYDFISSVAGAHYISHCTIFRPEVTFYESRNVEMQKLPSNHTFLEPGDQVLSSSRSRLGKYLQINCSLTFLTIVKTTKWLTQLTRTWHFYYWRFY
jgi:hypothetical protein